MRIPALFLVPALLIPSILRGETFTEGTTAQPEFTATLYGVESFRATDSTRDLRLSPIASSDAILQLRFEETVPALLRDSAGNYRVRANYVPGKDGPMGGFARFVRPENRIELSSPRELWPSSGDFTIEFWIQPVIFYTRNSIFKKISMLGGEKRGVEVYLESGRLKASFFDLFEDEQGERHTITLSSLAPLTGQKWAHVSVSYEASTGRVALYLDNREQSVQFAADSRSIWNASFQKLDRSPIVIGDNYFGALDEVSISDRVLSPEEHPRTRLPSVHISDVSYRPTQRSGIAVSRVIDAGESSSGRFRYAADEPPGTSIQFFIRTSEHAFLADAPDAGPLAWKRIRTATDSIPRFRFFQWKAVFNADPAGQLSPVLREVSLKNIELLPPSRPGGLRVIEELSSGNSVCLEWRKIPDPEIEESGGYIVYYGLRPGEYLGSIRIQNGKAIRHISPERMPMTKEEKRRAGFDQTGLLRELSGRMRLVIDNRTIEENIRGKRRGNMPFLREDRAYYFAVSAYTGEGESAQSKEAVTVLRPEPDL